MIPRCLCSHAASTHSGATGYCWSAACGCTTFRPDTEPRRPSDADRFDERYSGEPVRWTDMGAGVCPEKDEVEP